MVAVVRAPAPVRLRLAAGDGALNKILHLSLISHAPVLRLARREPSLPAC